jgi:hypothetical protein
MTKFNHLENAPIGNEIKMNSMSGRYNDVDAIEDHLILYILEMETCFLSYPKKYITRIKTQYQRKENN